MTQMEKFMLQIGGIVVISVMVGWGIKAFIERDDDLPVCMAGQDEICPPAKWMRAYRHMNDLQMALQAGIPGGYYYNGQGKFLKNRPAPPQPPK
jgi:hypothetical protein